MTEVILFHHAHGLTDGVRAFADDLRAAGHVVHLPDLYEGHTFDARADGVAHAQQIGFATVVERGRRAAAELPEDVVYAGFSLGVLPAQALAQNRPGARGALLLDGCVPPEELGGQWPDGVPAQIHMMEGDEEMLPPNEDLETARRLAGTVEAVTLFLYPGDGHLFADRGLPDYDAAAARLLTERVLDFLASRT
jgi:dienelactone hydrolase